MAKSPTKARTVEATAEQLAAKEQKKAEARARQEEYERKRKEKAAERETHLKKLETELKRSTNSLLRTLTAPLPSDGYGGGQNDLAYKLQNAAAHLTRRAGRQLRLAMGLEMLAHSVISCDNPYGEDWLDFEEDEDDDEV